MLNKFSLGVSFGTIFCSMGCANTSTVQVASSADQVGYAKTVPEGTASRANRYESDVQSTKKSLDSNFGNFVKELDDTNWDLVEDIYEKAELEGKSQAYLAHRAEAEAVLGFYEAEKQKIVSRVASASNQKAKDGGCNVQLQGSVDWSLQKVVVERLVERRREASDAHMLLHREEETLGKKNVTTLENQVDEIMFTSYMAHVGARAQQAELERLVDESGAAKDTLSDRIKEIDEKEKPSKDEEQERKDLKAALEGLQPAMDKAEAQLKDAEEVAVDLEERFEKAWDALKKQLREKQKEASNKEDEESEREKEKAEKKESEATK